jgi:hypothetical protein
MTVLTSQQILDRTNTLNVGHWVAVTVRETIAPLKCYVGKIEAKDDHGIRMTLIDWVTGAPASWDLFLPYSSIECALVATAEHDVEGFVEAAGKWQTRVNKIASEKTEQAPGQSHGASESK